MRPLGRGTTLVVLVAVLVTACAAERDGPAAGEPPPEGAPASPTEPAAADDAEAVACGPVEEPPLEGGGHLIGDEEPPAPYGTTPPTSGWHVSGAVEPGVRDHDDRLREPEQVSVLEMGGVVVTWRDLDEDDRQALEDFVRERYSGRVATTPYDALEPGQVALTAWGVMQRCDGLDLEAVAAFVEAHADPAEEGHDEGD